jgi:hypothetical protein
MTEEIRDFTRTRSHEPIRFKIDDDTFEAHPSCGAALLIQIGDIERLAQALNVDAANASAEQLKELQLATTERQLRLMNFLDAVLLPDSAERLAARLRSVDDPIELDQLQDVAMFLAMRYAARPTGPSSASSNGHDGGGHNSTGSARSKASTRSTSRRTGSST